MKISKIKLKNFKFFSKEETIELKGKNILIFGENGSGKSSIYWALYTLLQSSMKQDDEIKKYFIPDGNYSLLNKYEKYETAVIELEIKENEKKYYIKTQLDNNFKGDYECTTNSNSEIQEYLMASDFINYKIISKFYNFKNSEDLEVMNIFVEEIFPYISTSFQIQGKKYSNLKDIYYYLKDEKNLPERNSKKAVQEYEKILKNFNEEIEKVIGGINTRINNYLRKDFNEENLEIELIFSKFEYRKTLGKRSYNVYTGKIEIRAYLNFRGKRERIVKPHTFFNEAKLTSIALAIRFSLLENRLSKSELKILVLDDLLVSLDMSKRMQVMKIITTKFKEYQKIILTHDYAFFDVAKFYLPKSTDSEWENLEIHVNTFEHRPFLKETNGLLEKSEKYFNEHDYGASANYLRKACEKIIVNYLSVKDFSKMLEIAKKVFFYNKIHKELEKSLIDENVKEHLEKVKSESEELRRLKPRELGKSFGVINAYNERMEELLEVKDGYEELIEKIDQIRDVILNPQSHYDVETPIFREELRDAIEKVKELEKLLK